MNLLEHYRDNYSHIVRLNKHEATGLTCIKYKPDVYDFTDPYVRMARGLVLNDQGDIILRGFNKFFNWKQYDLKTTVDPDFKEEFTHMGSFSPDEKVTFYEKLDGTYIIVGLYEGEYLFATPGAIETPKYQEPVHRLLNEASQVKAWLEANPDMCLIFEYTSPYNIINVLYEEEALTLIGVVSKSEGDRHPLEMLAVAEELNLPSPKVYHMTIPEVSKVQEDTKGIEGFIAVNQYGKLLKFKTEDWFMHSNDFLHPYVNKSSRPAVRRIIQAVANGTIDDMLAHQATLSEKGIEDKITVVVECVEELLAEGQEKYLQLKHALDSAPTEEAKYEARVKFFDPKSKSATNPQMALVTTHLRGKTFSQLIEEHPARLKSFTQDIMERLIARGVSVTIEKPRPKQ